MARKISCPGVTSRPSLGARHSASFCAAASSSPGIIRAVLRCNVTAIIRTTTTTALAPASVHTRHGRARFPSRAVPASASTRARKSADGSAPCATSGRSASNRAARARTSSSSAEHFAQLRRCSSRPAVKLPVSAASRNGSFHFSHAFFISSLPAKVSAPRAAAIEPSPLEFQAPPPRRRPPSLQPAKPAGQREVSPAAVLFLSGAGPASPAAPHPSLRPPSLVFLSPARLYHEPAGAGSLFGGSKPAEKQSGSPTGGISPLPAAMQTSGRRAGTLPVRHLLRRRTFPECCRQFVKRAADSQQCARQIPARDYALRLWQSTQSRTRLSRLSYPFPYRHRGPAVRSGSYHAYSHYAASNSNHLRDLWAGLWAARPPTLGRLQSSWIRREISAETPEESVAVELQSARPEVSATAQRR